MRNFRVQVNGKAYDVVVEETGSSTPQIIQTPAAPAPQSAPKAAPAAPAAAAAPVAAGANSITVPMPGVILSINVKVGDSVAPNTVVAILEAMKMENEIFAGMSGVVASITATKGASVNTGDVILTLK